jgi:hypothetical protein
MRLVLTANGPGELAGWVRPLVRALQERDPALDVHLFLVPDDYATGREAAYARAAFPRATVYEPRDYLATAIGRGPAAVPRSADLVQYLGGDLMHAARLHRRFGGRAATYKFSRPAYSRRFALAFAVDERNARELIGWGMPPDRVRIVGNLAVDGALFDAAQTPEAGAPDDGILIMPGSRPYEIEHLVPLFFTAALRMVRERPDLRVAFAISPFTPDADLRAAIKRGGDPRVFAQPGRFEATENGAWLTDTTGSVRLPVVRNAMAAAMRARLVLTIPGTKVVELAALGRPVVAISPYNAPEMVTINGPLTYLDRIPLVGVPLKRAAVLAYARRHRFHTQPNSDAGEALVCEVHGTLTPGRIARVALERYDDRAWLQESARRLAALYAGDVGAAARMADALVELAG